MKIYKRRFTASFIKIDYTLDDQNTAIYYIFSANYWSYYTFYHNGRPKKLSYMNVYLTNELNKLNYRVTI